MIVTVHHLPTDTLHVMEIEGMAQRLEATLFSGAPTVDHLKLYEMEYGHLADTPPGCDTGETWLPNLAELTYDLGVVVYDGIVDDIDTLPFTPYEPRGD